MPTRSAHAAPRRRPRVVLKMDDFLSRCLSSYVVSHGQTPWLLRRQKRLYEEVAGSDDMAVELSRYGGSAVQPLTGARAEAAANLIGSGNALLTLAIPETTPREALRRTIALLNLHGLELQRAQVDVVNEHNDGGAPVTLLRAVVSPRDGDLLQDEAAVLVGDAARPGCPTAHAGGVVEEGRRRSDREHRRRADDAAGGGGRPRPGHPGRSSTTRS